MELYHSIRINWALYILKVLLVSVLFVMFYTMLSYWHESTALKMRQTLKQGDHMLEIIDSLYEVEVFTHYTSDQDNLMKVRMFYNQLNASEQFQYLVTSGQPVEIRNAQGGKKFVYDANFDGYIDEGESVFGVGDKALTSVKTIGMNRQAFEYYDIGSADSIDWDILTMSADMYPVILGNEYRHYYDVGDIIEGSYLFKDFQFEIVDFLTPNATIFYQNEADYLIDDYVVLPYAEMIQQDIFNESAFAQKYIFYLVNGSIIYQDNVDQIMNRIHEYAMISDFYAYDFIQVAPFYTQYTNLRNAVNDNQALINSIAVLCTIFVMTMCWLCNQVIYKRRRSEYLVHIMMGMNAQQLQWKFAKDGMYECVLFPFVYWWFIKTLKIVSIEGILFLFVVSICWCMMNWLMYGYQVKKTVSYIRGDVR